MSGVGSFERVVSDSMATGLRWRRRGADKNFREHVHVLCRWPEDYSNRSASEAPTVGCEYQCPSVRRPHNELEVTVHLILAVTITLLVASGAMAQTPPADPAAGARSISVEQQADQADFLAFLDRLDAVLQRFANGDADAFKDVWDHTDDVTVAGGFGGAIVQGWNVLSPRLSGVADTYTNTLFTTRRIAAGATRDFGYVIQHEYFRREEAGEPYRQYRVTMLFRLAAGEWKLFHRHADAQMEFRVPD